MRSGFCLFSFSASPTDRTWPKILRIIRQVLDREHGLPSFSAGEKIVFSLARLCFLVVLPARVDLHCQSLTLKAVTLTTFLCQTHQRISSTTAEARGRTSRARKSGRASARSGRTKA